VAIRWYLLYGLLYRDFALLLAERGIMVDYIHLERGDRQLTDDTYVKWCAAQRSHVSTSNTSRWTGSVRAIPTIGWMKVKPSYIPAARRRITRSTKFKFLWFPVIVRVRRLSGLW
jgi:hypothetical protein